MEPETLETILKWTSLGIGSIAGITTISALTSGISKYNVSKQTYESWTKIAEETKHESLKKYITEKQEELGTPNLKTYLKDAVKSITNIILKNETYTSHHDKITMQNIDVLWRRNLLDSSSYKLAENGELYEPGKNNLKIVS